MFRLIPIGHVVGYVPYSALRGGIEMVDIEALGLNDEPMGIAHEFEVDLNCVVIVNHNLTLEGITRSEDEDLSHFRMEVEAERSIASSVELFYQDLRRAANNSAVVGLVIRLQHWISKYVRELPG